MPAMHPTPATPLDSSSAGAPVVLPRDRLLVRVDELANRLNALAVSMDQMHRKLDYVYAAMPRTPPASAERPSPFI